MRSLWLTFLSPGFLDTMEYALELTVTILGPLIAIYAVDILLRRNRYNGIALNDERPGSPFWYSGGWYLARRHRPADRHRRSPSSCPTPRSTVGPSDAAMNGADLSAIVGPLVGGGLYALLWHTTAPFNEPCAAPRRRAATSNTPTHPSDPPSHMEVTAMNWRMPSETDPHERTWMAFPCEGPALGGDEESRELTYRAWAEVANAIVEFEPVSMLVDPTEARRARRMLSSEVELFETPIDECWMRDHGPTFVVDDDQPGHARRGGLGVQRVGRPRLVALGASEQERRFVADLVGATRISSLLVNEGGGIHVDGEGTVLLTETVQLDPRRNPYADKERVEAELRPHARRQQGGLAAARTHPRLRGLRHQRPRRHPGDDHGAGRDPAAHADQSRSTPTTR